MLESNTAITKTNAVTTNTTMIHIQRLKQLQQLQQQTRSHQLQQMIHLTRLKQLQKAKNFEQTQEIEHRQQQKIQTISVKPMSIQQRVLRLKQSLQIPRLRTSPKPQSKVSTKLNFQFSKQIIGKFTSYICL